MFNTRFAKLSDDEAEEEAIRKQNNIAYQRSEVDKAPQGESSLFYTCGYTYAMTQRYILNSWGNNTFSK